MKRWGRIVRLLPFLCLLLVGFAASQARAATPTIDVLRVKGTINPVLVDYVKRGIERAEADGALACVIQLDTPGGLDTAMRDIVQEIVNARVPVVVFVSPSGARAASAGAYITLAAHVAAMAPDTAIGAATPISVGQSGEVQVSDELQKKIINDAVAYIRSLAESHGRNADWAEKAVRDGVSASAQEALQLKVVDLIAPDLNALVAQLDGRKVTMLGGGQVTLNTQGAAINRLDMSWVEDFLYALADPNIAYILLSVAMLGIMAEIFNPGLIFPGVIGGICALLAVYSLGMLPVNYAGVLLIILAFGLFIAEVFTPGFGLLTAGGIVSLVLGSLILFKGGSPLFRVDPGLIATVTIVLAGFLAFVVFKVVGAHRRQATTGRELIGKTAVVRAALDPEGMVLFKGERWEAVSESGRVEVGEEVVITRADGLKLYVTRKR